MWVKLQCLSGELFFRLKKEKYNWNKRVFNFRIVVWPLRKELLQFGFRQRSLPVTKAAINIDNKAVDFRRELVSVTF